MSNLQVRMSLHEKVTLLIEEEIQDRVNSIITEYAKTISKKHAVPLELLLRDVPDTYTSSICKGTKSNGDRCTFRVVEHGYCRHHKSQGERICPRTLSSSSLHNHGPGQMFVRGCPGCESANNGLIDLNTII